MKKIIFILCVFYCLTTIAQNYELTYTISNDKEKILQKIKENKQQFDDTALFKKMINESKPIDFKVIANSSSLYSYKKRKVKPDNILQNLNNLLYLDSEEYFVDFLNDEYVFKKNISSKTYYVNFAPSEYNFVNNKTEVINGYRCNLAENKNNNIKVWYTKDIPLNAGPKKYLGLPGLVVKVELSEVNFITLKSIERTTDIIKEVPDDIQIIEFEDYNSEIGKMSKNFFEN